MLDVFFITIKRDLLLAFRRRSDVLTTVFFFIIVSSLFPLGVGAQHSLLQAIAPGILWVATLLASILSLNRLFATDYIDGTLEQLLHSSEPLVVIVVGKIVVHWLVSGLPLVMLSPVLALQFSLSGSSIIVLTLSLLIGTPVLSLLGAIGAALTLDVRGGGALITVLVLPLYIPILIFGAGAVDAQTTGLGSGPHLMLLTGLLLISGALAPWAISAALKVALE
jgi:heme exporter protein B